MYNKYNLTHFLLKACLVYMKKFLDNLIIITSQKNKIILSIYFSKFICTDNVLNRNLVCSKKYKKNFINMFFPLELKIYLLVFKKS